MDIESWTGDDHVHVPILIVAHFQCKLCCDDWRPTKDCQCFPHHQRVFSGRNCVADFVNHVFTPANKGAVIMACNSRGYDGLCTDV